jgi:hypothetical protein
MTFENAKLVVDVGDCPRNFQYPVIATRRKAQHLSCLMEESPCCRFYPTVRVDPPAGRMRVARNATHSRESLRLMLARSCNALPDDRRRFTRAVGAQVRERHRAGSDMHIDPVSKRS